MRNPYEDLIKAPHATREELFRSVVDLQKSIDKSQAELSAEQHQLDALQLDLLRTFVALSNASGGYTAPRLLDGDIEISQTELGAVEIAQLTPIQILAKENEVLKRLAIRRAQQIARIENSTNLMELLSRRIEIGHILHRIAQKTHKHLMTGNNELIDKFIPKSTKAFLISIDIRGSTDLMLNAKDASKFAAFLNELSSELADIVKEHFGIFDKFTGDGVLAFFPEYFSGESASLNVLLVAKKAHAFFVAHYKAFRNSFDVLVETGLGIGIDYGYVDILQQSDGLTAVGKPVVYACRFGGGVAGTTLVNQGAYEMMISADSALEFDEIPTSIKNQERKFLAYRPKNSPRSELIKEPDWFSASPTSAE